LYLCNRKQDLAPYAEATEETPQTWGQSPPESDFCPSPEAGIAAYAEMDELKCGALADVLNQKQDNLHQMPN